MVTYPSDWEKDTVSNVVDITTGCRDTQDNKANGKYPFFVRSPIVERIDVADFDCEAVLTAGDGIGTGKVYHYVKGKFSAHQRVYVMSNFRNIDGKYFYYFFSKNFFKEVEKYTAKSSVDSVRRAMIADMEFVHPSVSEQREIVKVLSDFDAYIDNLSELINKKKSIRDGALVDLISGRTRLEGFDYEWDNGKIGDILKILHGKSQRGVESYNGKYPILGTGGVIGKATEYLCDWECVLIGRKGTIDKPIYMNSPFWTIDTLYYSKPVENQCVKFQYYIFCAIPWYDYTESSGRPSLSRKVIENIPIRIPKYEEQQAIASVLTAMDKEIENLEAERDKMIQIREGAMDDLLTGRVRLTV
ncbi:restriction endonuclease subunit S [Mahella australiensis]|uniref:Restriction modification system DNA specificity domain protein n=1 Tax=Mahella australiensis (strain DSM 15567 / CIP 107919 / 50-1 BON) TaxID=697281 RepID=F4A0B4_MAHA5|nr:restriction endonuclease subunit S [Mahella australiensis]AEE97975.1 restriction modification system DNA specificity domain protein [Mahella australiensis 50-1 BON]